MKASGMRALGLTLGAGALLCFGGMLAGHQNVAVARLYRATIHFTHHFFVGSDGLSNEKITPPQTTVLGTPVPGDTLITRSDGTVQRISPTGEVRQQWGISLKELWPEETAQDRGRSFAYIASADITDDGEMIAVYQDSATGAGIGVARIGAQGELRWKKPINAHDDLLQLSGEVYVLSPRPVTEPDGATTPFAQPITRTDTITVLDAKSGEVRDVISLMDAFIGTPFEPMLYSYGSGKKRAIRASSIQRLPTELEGDFPQFPKGCLLLSFESLNVAAALHPITGKVLWATRGPWYRPTGAVFAPGGKIWVLDGQGYYNGKKVPPPRLLAVDAQTQSILESRILPSSPMVSPMPQGSLQLLPAGGLLVALPRYGQALEYDASGALIWQHSRDEILASARRLTRGEGQ